MKTERRSLMLVRIIYHNAENTHELDRFRDVIANDLLAHINSVEIERVPTETIAGICVIEFVTTSDFQHVRTMLGQLGSSFELFDDSGTSIKKLIETAQQARQIPQKKRKTQKTK